MGREVTCHRLIYVQCFTESRHRASIHQCQALPDMTRHTAATYPAQGPGRVDRPSREAQGGARPGFDKASSGYSGGMSSLNWCCCPTLTTERRPLLRELCLREKVTTCQEASALCFTQNEPYILAHCGRFVQTIRGAMYPGLAS